MAGLLGLDPRFCPFDKMTAEWREWQSFHGKAVDYVRSSSLTVEQEQDRGHLIRLRNLDPRQLFRNAENLVDCEHDPPRRHHSIRVR